MQDFQKMQELSDEDLEMVAGGKNPTTSGSWTSAVANAQAAANGGHFHIDKVFTMTKSVSIAVDGESVSGAFAVAIGVAL